MEPIAGLIILILLAAVVWLLRMWARTDERLAFLERQFKEVIARLSQVETPKTNPIPPPKTALSPEPHLGSETETIATPPARPPLSTPPLLPEIGPPSGEPRKSAPALLPPLPSSPPRTPPLAHPRPGRSSTWERFLGVNIFAWVGGFALFLGVAFFIKFSFEQGWVSPSLRVITSGLTGLGLIAGGWLVRSQRQMVTAQTLCAAGVVILYASAYGAHSFYHLIAQQWAFLFMSVITIGAFLLASKLNAHVIAVLGLAGGLLTPPLLSTGVDKPIALFSYVALLDVGLLALALRRRWTYLVALAAGGTILLQIGWVGRFFHPNKILVADGIFLGFAILFVVFLAVADRQQIVDRWVSTAALLLPSSALLFAGYLLLRPFPSLVARPTGLFTYVFLVDLALLAAAWLRPNLRSSQVTACWSVFLLLCLWTSEFIRTETLGIGLAFYLLFAILHTVFPIAVEKYRPGKGGRWAAHFPPVLALFLILIPLWKLDQVTFLVWPVVLLIDLLAVALAIVTAALETIFVVLLLTVLLSALWIFQRPPQVDEVPSMLALIGGFAVFFFAAGIVAGRRARARTSVSGRGGPALTAPMFEQLSGLSAALPFVLLLFVLLRLPLPNPTSVFGLAAILALLLLGVAWWFKQDTGAAVAFGGVLFLEHIWYLRFGTVGPSATALNWHLGFAALFFLFPFLARTRLEQRLLLWTVSTLAWPAHFWLLHRTFELRYPGMQPGWVPLLLAIPYAAAFWWAKQAFPGNDTKRLTLLALFGGGFLFFVTLIFPIQFEHQWLTVSWALEGAALLGLYHRVPHRGLVYLGTTLLAVSFCRSFNPEIFDYYPRTGPSIFNWYLYSHGIVTVCLLAGGILLAPPRQKVGPLHAQGILFGLGVILGFFLLNIEIANYFSAGTEIRFDISGSFAHDMTYSLAWGLFAFLLLGLGFRFRNGPTRYAGMALLVFTLLKLFLHDLWRLGGLYRIGSLLGLAVVLILVSFIYQRFLSVDDVPAARRADLN